MRKASAAWSVQSWGSNIFSCFIYVKMRLCYYVSTREHCCSMYRKFGSSVLVSLHSHSKTFWELWQTGTVFHPEDHCCSTYRKFGSTVLVSLHSHSKTFWESCGRLGLFCTLGNTIAKLSERVVADWDSLPDRAVTALSVSLSKACLDTHWKNLQSIFKLVSL